MTVYSSPYGTVHQHPRPVHYAILSKISEVCEKDPSKPAFVTVDDSSVVTYSRLRDECISLSHFLSSRGFQRQTACIVLSNRYEYLPFLVAVNARGGIQSGASALFTQSELAQQMRDSKATLILTDEDHLDLITGAAKGNDSIKTIVVIGVSSNASLPSHFVDWSEAVRTAHDGRLASVPVDVDKDIAFLPYSSGTTGVPKGVMLTHTNVVSTFDVLLHWLVDVNSRGRTPLNWSEEKTLLYLPFYHMYGQAKLCATVLLGGTGVIISAFNPLAFLEAIQEHEISLLLTVPPILVFLAKSPLCANYNLSSIRRLATGAAPAGKDLCDDVMRRYPHLESIEQLYGQSECILCTSPDEGSRRKMTCVGKVAQGHEMRLVDPDTGKDAARGDRGEIWMKGPAVMAGYLGRPDATAETIVDGWLHTGDIAIMDDDGDVFIVDRLKELIKVKGLQVAPAELEDLLLSHPKIADAAVIGVPDERSGELPKAFIVKADDTLTEKEINEYMNGKVSVYKRLGGGIEFIPEVPRTPSGKIMRKDLRARQNRSRI